MLLIERIRDIMRKRISVFVLAAVMILSCISGVQAEEKQFTDMNNSHWAYGLVQQLVEEGIINGYEDGTFRPENTVTRAEFAKLFGKGSKIKPADFVDLPRVHWAYSYIMKSGIDVEQERFYPDREMTRGEALKALYDRYGTKTKYYAPSVITSQYKANPDAAAWAYSKQLIIGDDGINLRLNDTITRAEAVALILRARNVKEAETAAFIDLVDDVTLEKYFNYIPAFSALSFEKNKTITNGEFADVIVKITDYDIANGSQYKPAYEGKYATQIAYLSSVWGRENNNAEFENSQLTVKNAITGFVFAATIKANGMLSLSGKNETYPDVTPKGEMEKTFLTYAYENGIFLSKDKTLNPDKKITLKELVCYYMQMDDKVGFEESYNGSYKNESSDLNVNQYPSNYTQYAVILENVPNEVYAGCGLINPKEYTPLIKEYREVFEDILGQVNTKIKSVSLGARATYYPTLISVEENNVKLVIKLDVEENIHNVRYSDIFRKVNTEDGEIKAGTYYLIVSTNAQLTYGFELDTLSLEKII